MQNFNLAISGTSHDNLVNRRTNVTMSISKEVTYKYTTPFKVAVFIFLLKNNT